MCDKHSELARDWAEKCAADLKKQENRLIVCKITGNSKIIFCNTHRVKVWSAFTSCSPCTGDDLGPLELVEDGIKKIANSCKELVQAMRSQAAFQAVQPKEETEGLLLYDEMQTEEDHEQSRATETEENVKRIVKGCQALIRTVSQKVALQASQSEEELKKLLENEMSAGSEDDREQCGATETEENVKRIVEECQALIRSVSQNVALQASQSEEELKLLDNKMSAEREDEHEHEQGGAAAEAETKSERVVADCKKFAQGVDEWSVTDPAADANQKHVVAVIEKARLILNYLGRWIKKETTKKPNLD